MVQRRPGGLQGLPEWGCCASRSGGLSCKGGGGGPCPVPQGWAPPPGCRPGQLYLPHSRLRVKPSGGCFS